MTTTQNYTYYNYIVDIILQQFQHEFTEAKPGHCMKITGLADEQLFILLDKIRTHYPKMDSFIINDAEEGNQYISATKLIELRNNQSKPILILIPSNSRTAAEDSYGNATFKDLQLDNIDRILVVQLLKEIPEEKKKSIQTIVEIFNINKNNNPALAKYLILLEENNYDNKAIGEYLFLIGGLPDHKLLEDPSVARARLILNQKSLNILASFNKSIYDRVDSLEIEKDSIQKDLIQFFKEEKNVANKSDIVENIFTKYPNLSFGNWKIPNLKFDDLNLEVTNISSPHFVMEDGTKVLKANEGKNVKVKVQFTTTPPPNQVERLHGFRIVLMVADGGAGQEITTLRKLKNSKAASIYRSADIEINSNTTEEMTYFFKVYAEDEHGNILNANDDFASDAIQKAWEEQGKSPEAKEELNFKLKSDSEDFYFAIDEAEEDTKNIRKDKLNNVTQAHFKFNLDNLKNGIEADFPIPTESANSWLNDEKPKLNSTFYINYGVKFNYQIIISSKLRYLENELLKQEGNFGHLYASLNPNFSALNFDGCEFRLSPLNEVVPNKVKETRSKLFKAIKESNRTENGIVETVNLVELKEEIKTYLEAYNKWIKELNNKINKSIEQEDKEQLKSLYADIQFLDLIKVKTLLPTKEPIEILLLSPLHPLRLSWMLELIERFEFWYKETLIYKDHDKEWSALQNLFLGDLIPSNNPFVFADPQSFDNYEYLGEIAFGWGIYVSEANKGKDDSLAPKTYQIKQYVASLLNISNGNGVDTNVSKSLIIKHLKNYLQQHPYVDKLVLNLFNVGDANKFAEAFIDIIKIKEYVDIKFEVRLFVAKNNIIEPGDALKDLINPERNVSEEAEAFSQASINRLFPKLRFSINNIEDFLANPSVFNAHVSFIVNPFSPKITLTKPVFRTKNEFLNGLIFQSNTDGSFDEITNGFKWVNYQNIAKEKEKVINTTFANIQENIAATLAAHQTDSIPAIELNLSNRDNVLLSNLHEFSDWVITFDKFLGPQIFDQPSEDNKIPFLLDYIPGEEISGVSSYLTTKPNEEIYSLIAPHFEKFNIDIEKEEDKISIQNVLEDVRALSSSLILQLNSSKNRAFEVIGSAFSKRVLDKKHLLKNAFIIPIDLHQNLFNELETNSKSRADNLFIRINPKTREINCSVLEIKCRTYLNVQEREDLKLKMLEQIDNTIFALKSHFDPNNFKTKDRLDREIKNKEFKNLLEFYIERAFRYNTLEENSYRACLDFIQTLDSGFTIKFNRLGFIFDFSFDQKHLKQVFDDNTTIFTFGEGLIKDILDPNSDLNTLRLEDSKLKEELIKSLDYNDKLKQFVGKYKTKLKAKENDTEEEFENDKSAKDIKELDNPTITETPIISISEPIVQIETIEKELVDEEAPIASQNVAEEQVEYVIPKYDILIGKSSDSSQYGVLGTSIHNKKIAIDLSETNTISLFGVQGGGKSYTIGTLSEMVLKHVNNINKLSHPLAGVIFHYSESMDYEPEFTSMIYPNDVERETTILKERYGAEPNKIEDVILLTPKDKVDERKAEFPSIEVRSIGFNSKELNVQDWMFLLGAIGNESSYIKQLKAMMKEMRRNITLDGLKQSVEDNVLLSNTQKALARQRLRFAEEYIDDDFFLKESIKPGRLVIVDLRDEFIEKDEALGLFVIMLNIFSGVKEIEGQSFNKFIVFDEAHKYMDNKDLTNNIVTAIREMRHKGVSIMIASQDPPSLPNEIIELSSVVLVHKFNSPQWLKHIQKSITQLSALTPNDMSMLKPGEGFLWASKATENAITNQPQKISTRPRFSKHGGATLKADR
ncbi:methylation-associated defense system ATP-binding protein MAD8 [Sphingobacterium sp.]|uniref:methylation-associated defense system ATP-binding protein MAD8 n=1 Tax=Sphingobacterium sp. TaxID=341027 RepID=UPI0028A0B8AF|nr:hypothetical protein [Sphingobacterium sp.]